MPLRLRLFLLILALVAVSMLSLSALILRTLINSLTADAIERGELAGSQISTLVVNRINQHAQEYPAALSVEEVKDRWNDIVRYDPDVAKLLTGTVGTFRNVLEINISGEDGNVLVSSTSDAAGSPPVRREDFRQWFAKAWYRRAADLI